jgi:hypothetical protein
MTTDAICLSFDLQIEEGEMASEIRSSPRQGEAFWRAHQETWKRRDLNQRQYCEADIPLNGLATGGRSSKPSHSRLSASCFTGAGIKSPLKSAVKSSPTSTVKSPDLSLLVVRGPIVPRPREGHRRRFTEADKRRILEEAAQGGTSVAEVAHRCGIDRRVLTAAQRCLMPTGR